MYRPASAQYVGFRIKVSRLVRASLALSPEEEPANRREDAEDRGHDKQRLPPDLRVDVVDQYARTRPPTKPSGKIGTPLIRNHRREMRTATTENPAPWVSNACHGPWAKRGAPLALQNRAARRIGAPHRWHGGGAAMIGTSKSQTI